MLLCLRIKINCQCSWLPSNYSLRHLFDQGFPLWGKGTGGFPPLPEKLACPPMSLPLFCPKNVDFVIFVQFLTIFPKLSPPISRPHLGNPVDYAQFLSLSPPKKLKTYVYHWINPIPYNDRTFSKIYVTYFKLSTLAACAVLELPPSTF